MVKKNEFENVHSKNGCDGTRSEKNSEKKKRGDSDAIEYFTIFLLESTEKTQSRNEPLLSIVWCHDFHSMFNSRNFQVI